MLKPNAFVTLHADGRVQVLTTKTEGNAEEGQQDGALRVISAMKQQTLAMAAFQQ